MRDGTLNLEKMNVLSLAEQETSIAPRCPRCRRRMESAGRDQGYRCRKCKTRTEGRERRTLARDLETGFYEVPPCARRHLSMPLVRMEGMPGSTKVHPSR
jgi:tRNA(Ile2)-agmatinylcytidine synthase